MILETTWGGGQRQCLPAHQPPTRKEGGSIQGCWRHQDRNTVSCHPALTRILTESGSVLFPKDMAFKAEEQRGPYEEGMLVVAFRGKPWAHWAEQGTSVHAALPPGIGVWGSQAPLHWSTFGNIPCSRLTFQLTAAPLTLAEGAVEEAVKNSLSCFDQLPSFPWPQFPHLKWVVG